MAKSASSSSRATRAATSRTVSPVPAITTRDYGFRELGGFSRSLQNHGEMPSGGHRRLAVPSPLHRSQKHLQSSVCFRQLGLCPCSNCYGPSRDLTSIASWHQRLGHGHRRIELKQTDEKLGNCPIAVPQGLHSSVSVQPVCVAVPRGIPNATPSPLGRYQSAASVPKSNPGTEIRGMGWPITRSIKRTIAISSGDMKVKASPSLAALPVRPIRWT